MPIPAGAAALSRSLLRDDVYVRLRDAIVDGTFTPGEQLRDGDLAQGPASGAPRCARRCCGSRRRASWVVGPGPLHHRQHLSTLRAARDAQAVVAAMHELAVGHGRAAS